MAAKLVKSRPQPKRMCDNRSDPCPGESRTLSRRDTSPDSQTEASGWDLDAKFQTACKLQALGPSEVTVSQELRLCSPFNFHRCGLITGSTYRQLRFNCMAIWSPEKLSSEASSVLASACLAALFFGELPRRGCFLEVLDDLRLRGMGRGWGACEARGGFLKRRGLSAS